MMVLIQHFTPAHRSAAGDIFLGGFFMSLLQQNLSLKLFSMKNQMDAWSGGNYMHFFPSWTLIVSAAVNHPELTSSFFIIFYLLFFL